MKLKSNLSFLYEGSVKIKEKSTNKAFLPHEKCQALALQLGSKTTRRGGMFDKHGVFRIVTVYQMSLPAKTVVSDLWTSMKITSV